MKKYFQAPWSLKEVILIITSSAILILLSAIVLHLTAINEIIETSKYRSLMLIGLFLLQWLLIIAPMLGISMYKQKHRLKWGDLGFKKISPVKTLGLVAWGYLIFLSVTLIISLIILYTGVQIPGYQVQEQILPIFGTDLVSLIIAGSIIVVIAPIIEEIYFRGFLLRALSDKFGIIYGSIISAAIFATLHLQFQSIIPLFVLGLIINSLVIKSKSLWPAISFHILNNAIAFTLRVLILKEIISLESIV